LIAGHLDAQSSGAVRRRTASLRRGEESLKTSPLLRIVAAKLLFSASVTSTSAKRHFWYSGLLFDALIAYSYNNPRLQETRAASAEKRDGKPRSYKTPYPGLRPMPFW